MKAGWLLFALVAALALPLAIPSSYALQLVNLGLLNLIVVVGLNYITGWSGQINFGQAAFYGIGAYVSAILTLHGLPFWLALPAATCAAGLFGLALGIPTLRLKTFYLAMATIGFGEIIQLILIHWTSVTGGTSGLRGVPGVALGPFKLTGHLQHYYFLLFWALFAVFVALRIRASTLGRSMLAGSSSELAAELTGVDTIRVKMTAFVLSAMYAGAAGSLYAGYVGYVSPDQYTNGQAILFFTMLIAGGTGSVAGAAIGAATLTLLPEMLRFLGQWYMVLYGIGVILIILFLPEGIVGLAARIREWRGASRRPQPAPPAAPSPVASARPTRHEPAAPNPLRSPPTAAASPLLAGRGVTLRFGGVVALDGVDLEVRAGEVHAIIGPNGSGKTTLLNVLSGAYVPESGSVRLDGNELVGLRPNRIARLGLSRTFQNIRLFGNLSVRENIMVAQARHRRATLPEIIAGASRHRADEAAALARADEALADVGLEARAGDRAASLPYAQQRLLELARALATEPRVLLLDEPAAGMNPHEARDLMRLVRDLRDRGLSVLLVEHNMRLVMGISDRITVLEFGRVIATGAPAQVRSNPRVIKAYLGEDHGTA